MLSGIWYAAQPRRCVNRAGDSVPCGTEIGGSPLGGNLGRNLPGRNCIRRQRPPTPGHVLLRASLIPLRQHRD
jgi:hypothetical protein